MGPPPHDEPGFVVTMKDLYDKLVGLDKSITQLPPRVSELERTATDVEARLRHLDASKLSVEDYRIDRVQAISTLKDHESRIRVVEKLGNRFGGAWGIVAGIAAIGGGVMIDHILR